MRSTPIPPLASLQATPEHAHSYADPPALPLVLPRLSVPRAVALALLVASTTACRDTAAAFGATPAEARANSAGFFRSMAVRFTNVERDSAFNAARGEIARHALSPSRVYDTPRIWTSSSVDSVRTLEVRGHAVPATTGAPRYRFEIDPSARAPVALGDARHITRLRRDGDGRYTWFTEVDQAVGPIGASDLARATTAWLGAPGQRRPDAIRTDYRTRLPRTTTHLATLFSLDSLDVRPEVDGSSAIALHIRLRPDGLHARWPYFERYVRKYVEPLRFRFTLTDRAENPATYFDVQARDRRMVVRYRAREGQLLPLAGGTQPMPDKLRLEQDVFARFGPFTVGATDLVSDVTVERSAGVLAWTFQWRREPRWHFPLAVNAFIRSPLRYPFEGDGMWIRLALEERPGAQTLLTRRSRIRIRESTLVRWLGGLGSDAMGEFAGRAEAEENQWLAVLFDSLRADLLTVLGASCPAPPSVSCEPEG
jgi:hypothetical protein